jgi:hypothetical protein
MDLMDKIASQLLTTGSTGTGVALDGQNRFAIVDHRVQRATNFFGKNVWEAALIRSCSLKAHTYREF